MSTLLSGLISDIDSALLSSAFYDSDGGELFILAFLLAGPIYFFAVYYRYRNKDKRHFHEKETPAQMSNLQSYDNFRERLTRQNSKRLKGENGRRVEGSLVPSKKWADKGS